MAINISLQYYRSGGRFDYGKSLVDDRQNIFARLGETNQTFKKTRINNIPYRTYFCIPGTVRFRLETTYPGLILGAGYSHPKLGNSDKDFQLGFFFDHTTGMPVIPGSSVKGVLKSVFPKEKDSSEIIRNKIEYINDQIPQSDMKVTIDEKNWQEIFFERKQVFWDAYISGLPTDKQVFADDYICPHTAGIFKEPNPIRFLKIAPGVIFTFQIKIHEYQTSKNGVLTAEHIKEIFKRILLDFGVGAKRNVGYGAMVESSRAG